MIDTFRLMLKTLTSAQEHIGADAVPFAFSAEIRELLALGDRAYADAVDRAQHDGLITRRWGGFVSVSSSGREIARGPGSDQDAANRAELALAELLVATVLLRRTPMGNLAAAETKTIPHDVRAAITSLGQDGDSARANARAAVERIEKTARRIAQIRNSEPLLLEATTRISGACAAVLGVTVD